MDNQPQFDFASLPDEITGKNGVTPVGVPTHEEIAAEVELQRRKEEARAIAAITARKNGQTLANQQAQTHTPDEGAAAGNPPSAGVPSIPTIPNQAAAPESAPVATPKTTAPVVSSAGPKKPRQLTDLTNAPQNPLETASAAVDAAGAKLSAASKDVGESEAQAQLNETYARREQATNANVMSALQKLDLQDADQKVAAAREEASKKGFTGYFSGKNGTRRLILDGIATLLGSVSFDSQHVNHVVTQIDNAINQEFNQQTAEKADLWKQVAAAVDQKQMLSRDQLNEMAQFRANQAMALDAVISKGKYLSTLSKNREGIAAVEQNNARLSFERDQAIDESKRLWVASSEAERHHKVDESIERSKVGVERDKAGLGGNEDLRGAEKVGKLAGKLYDEKSAKKIVQTTNEARDLVNLLEKDPTALASGLAMERLVSVFSGGGKASTTALKLVDAHAGSWADISASKLREAFSGNQGAGKRNKIVTLAKEELADKEGAVKRSRASADAGLAGLGRLFPGAVDNYKKAIFGAENPAQSNGRPAAPPGYTDTGRTAGGKPVYKAPNGQLVVAQ